MQKLTTHLDKRIILLLTPVLVLFLWLAQPKSTPMFTRRPSTTHTSYKPVFEDKSACEELKEQILDDLPQVRTLPLHSISYTWEKWYSSWVRYGDIASTRIPEPKVDLIYTWVNASEERFLAFKETYELQSPLINGSISPWHTNSKNRHRDWDELRYSFRSQEYVVDAINTVTVITTRRGEPSTQKPNWMIQKFDHLRPKLHMIAQEDLYTDEQAICLPTFSSPAVEAQMPNIKTPGQLDNFVSLSDDFFFGAHHSPSDLVSPLYGRPLSHMSHVGYLVHDEIQVPEFDLEAWTKGEWPYIQYTSAILGQRFGRRGKDYPRHHSHSMSREILNEIKETFPLTFAYTPLHKFRGEEQSMHLWYLYNHFTMERHRESLLHSYFVLKADLNGDGYLDYDEREQIMLELSQINSRPFERQTLTRMEEMYNDAGLKVPQVQIPYWSSMDGPFWAFDVNDVNTERKENISDASYGSVATKEVDRYCFPEEWFDEDRAMTYKVKAFSIFKRYSFYQRGCGDKIINHLVRLSGPVGLNAFLPEDEVRAQSAIAAIMKYSYVMTKNNYEYIDFFGRRSAQAEFPKLLDKRPGEFCINDQINEDENEALESQPLVFDFLETYFPTKSYVEI